MPKQATPKDPPWLPKDAVPDYLGGETDSTYKGRPFRRFVRVIAPGEMRLNVEVVCVQCEYNDRLYGDPFIHPTQAEVQFRNEAWSLTADGWMCGVCMGDRPRGVKIPRRQKQG